MKLTRGTLLASSALGWLGLAAGLAWGGIPCAGNCIVAPRLVSCPAGDSTFIVVTRHCDNNPWSEGPVNLHFCGCPGYHLSLVGSHPYTINPDLCSISMIPDLLGVSRFSISGGGLCPGGTVSIDADYVPLGTRWVVSLDQNGDLRVDAADLALVYSKLGTTDPTADFDGDGVVSTADVKILSAHLGHAAPDTPTAALPSSWGQVKIRYR